MKKTRPTIDSLTKATKKRCSVFYRGVPCVLCGATNTCGHHINIRSRCRAGWFDVGNIVPLCATHHTSGGRICAHHIGKDSLPPHRFMEWMKEAMPVRYKYVMDDLPEKVRKLAEENQKWATILNVQGEHDYWETVVSNKRDYRFICEVAGFEAYGDFNKLCDKL